MGLFGKKKDIKTAETAVAAAPGAGLAEGPNDSNDSNDELACVIMAAIAAYESEQHKQTLYIRKLNRAAGVRPAWGVMGMTEAIDTRRM